MSNDVNQGMVPISIVQSEKSTNSFRVVIDPGQPPHMGTLQQKVIVETGERGKIGYRWFEDWRDVPVVERGAT